MSILRSAGVASTSCSLSGPCTSSPTTHRLPPRVLLPINRNHSLAWDNGHKTRDFYGQRLLSGGFNDGRGCVRLSARVVRDSARAAAAGEPPAFPPPSSQLEDLQGDSFSSPDDDLLGQGSGTEDSGPETNEDTEARARKSASKRLMARLRGARLCAHVAEASRDAAEAGGLDDIGASFALSSLSKLRGGREGEDEAVAEAVQRLQVHLEPPSGVFPTRESETSQPNTHIANTYIHTCSLNSFDDKS
jgi:hypothetical protein